MAVGLTAGRAAPAQVPSGTLPPVTIPTPQLPPPAGLPAPSPLPRLVPADAPSVPGTMPFLANPTPPAPLPVLAPAATITLSKPAGAETTRPFTAQPVSRSPMTTAPVPYTATRPQVVPVVAQPPADPKPPDKSPPEKSLEDKTGGNSDAKDKGKLAPIVTLDPNVPPIAREDAFRLDGDDDLNKRIVAALVKAETKNNADFVYKASDYVLPQPAKVGASGVAYVPKTANYSPTTALIEPGYLVHRRLLFEEKNSERNGWDLGFIQPLVSTAYFCKDALLLPAHIASNLTERYDASAGKCLPGNTVPYYLYPEEITLFGATVGAVVVTGAAFVFP